jgi:hypothetical protein
MAWEIDAKFAGTCQCGAEIVRGDVVMWEKRRGVVECRACRPKEPDAPDAFDQLVEDRAAEAAGVGDNDPGRW